MRLAENIGRKKVAKNLHLGTIAQLCWATSSQLKGTHRQSEKNLLSSNMSSRCPHNIVNFSPPAAEIGLPVWGTPANLNSFHDLAALLHGSQVVSISQTMRRGTEGATYVRQGNHHVGHWPTFLVKHVLPTLAVFVKLSHKITTLGAFGCLLHHKNQHEKHTDWLLITNTINVGGTSLTISRRW